MSYVREQDLILRKFYETGCIYVQIYKNENIWDSAEYPKPSL
jgi:hypothetical protein